MLTKTEAEKAIKHNAKVLAHNLKTRDTSFKDIIFWEGVRGRELSADIMIAKGFDILGCAAIGVIPSVFRRGADGFAYGLASGQVLEFEAKLCGIDTQFIFAGTRGGLYWSSDIENRLNICSVQSYFAGAFQSGMTNKTLLSKERRTALVCFDRNKNSIIGAWMLSPQETLSQLQKRKNQSSVTLKLSVFQNNGTPLQTLVPQCGYNTWEKEQVFEARKAGRIRTRKQK